MFNWMHCPLFQSKLSWPMRIMYSSGVWSYIVGAISTPTFIIIPAVTIWFGVFPIVVSRWTALGVTVYYFATNMVRIQAVHCTCWLDMYMHPFHSARLSCFMFWQLLNKACTVMMLAMPCRCSTMYDHGTTLKLSGLQTWPISSCGESCACSHANDQAV